MLEKDASTPIDEKVSRARRLFIGIRYKLPIALSLLVFLLFFGWKLAAIVPKGFGYNMDRLFYAACALEFETSDIEEIHHITYKELKKAVPRRRWKVMSVSNANRRIYSSEPDKFAKQLPFYRPRVFYNGLIFLLYKSGIPLGHSQSALNFGAYFILTILLLIWMWRRFGGVWGPLIVAGLSSAPFLVSVAVLGTPDIFVTTWVAVSLFFLIELEKPRIALGLLPVAVLIRPDTIVFIAIVCLALVFFERPSLSLPRIWPISSLGAAIILFSVTKIVTDGYGWWTVLQYTMVKTGPNIEALSPSFELDMYLDLLKKRVLRECKGNILYHLAGALVCLRFLLAPNKRIPNFRSAVARILLFSILVTVIVRYLLFPVFWSRLDLAYIISIQLIILVVVSASIRNSRAADSRT